MNKDLSNLVKLHAVDLQIIELELSKEEFPATVVRLESEIAKAKELVEIVEKKLADLANEKKDIKEQVGTANLSLEKSQDRLNCISTNKEFDAVHSEIESQKHIVETADKRIERFSTDISEQEALLNDTQNAFDKISADNQPQIDELKEKIAHIDSNVAKVQKEREALASNIHKPFIRTYNNIRSGRKKGDIIGLVSNANRTCQVCYQELQPHVVGQIRKGQSLYQCQSCGAILIWQDNIKE